MRVTLYLPYYDYNDDLFNTDDKYYGDGEYANAIADEFNKNKDIVYNSMIDYNNGDRNVFTGQDGQTYKFNQKASQNEDKVAYASCEGVMYNEDGETDNVDLLIEHFAKQESFVEMVEFDMDTPEEEFETELSLWTKEHANINKYKPLRGEEWAWGNEPKRNVKISFKNKANETIYAVLENCKIMDIVDRNMYILFVDKISLIDKI